MIVCVLLNLKKNCLVLEKGSCVHISFWIRLAFKMADWDSVSAYACNVAASSGEGISLEDGATIAAPVDRGVDASAPDDGADILMDAWGFVAVAYADAEDATAHVESTVDEEPLVQPGREARDNPPVAQTAPANVSSDAWLLERLRAELQKTPTIHVSPSLGLDGFATPSPLATAVMVISQLSDLEAQNDDTFDREARAFVNDTFAGSCTGATSSKLHIAQRYKVTSKAQAWTTLQQHAASKHTSCIAEY